MDAMRCDWIKRVVVIALIVASGPVQAFDDPRPTRPGRDGPTLEAGPRRSSLPMRDRSLNSGLEDPSGAEGLNLLDEPGGSNRPRGKARSLEEMDDPLFPDEKGGRREPTGAGRVTPDGRMDDMDLDGTLTRGTLKLPSGPLSGGTEEWNPSNEWYGGQESTPWK
ncbi:MAG: hypothetical protein HQL91_07565 [Magnetococcales bacterium]|nr:hypothetical protein [Magnetococcales bacterium]